MEQIHSAFKRYSGFDYVINAKYVRKINSVIYPAWGIPILSSFSKYFCTREATWRALRLPPMPLEIRAHRFLSPFGISIKSFSRRCCSSVDHCRLNVTLFTSPLRRGSGWSVGGTSAAIGSSLIGGMRIFNFSPFSTEWEHPIVVSDGAWEALETVGDMVCLVERVEVDAARIVFLLPRFFWVGESIISSNPWSSLLYFGLCTREVRRKPFSICEDVLMFRGSSFAERGDNCGFIFGGGHGGGVGEGESGESFERRLHADSWTYFCKSLGGWFFSFEGWSFGLQLSFKSVNFNGSGSFDWRTSHSIRLGSRRAESMYSLECERRNASSSSSAVRLSAMIRGFSRARFLSCLRRSMSLCVCLRKLRWLSMYFSRATSVLSLLFIQVVLDFSHS